MSKKGGKGGNKEVKKKKNLTKKPKREQKTK